MILNYWNQYSKFPFGRWLFNLYLRYFIPYTGSIRPEVLELQAGHAKVQMRDRKMLRNHLGSIHAAALMNLSEVTSGLAFVVGLPKNARAIVTEFKVEYKKKARGKLTAESHCTPPAIATEGHYQVQAFVRDESGDTVAIGTATWFVREAK